MKEERQREKLEAELLAQAQEEDEKKKKPVEDGCSWGIGKCHNLQLVASTQSVILLSFV